MHLYQFAHTMVPIVCLRLYISNLLLGDSASSLYLYTKFSVHLVTFFYRHMAFVILFREVFMIYRVLEYHRYNDS